MQRFASLKMLVVGVAAVGALVALDALVGTAEEAKPAPAVAAPPILPAGAVDDRGKFTKVVVDKTFRAEGVAVADVNKDGKLDILAGEVWYEGPDWKMHEIVPPGNYGNGAGGYSKCFQNYAMDVKGDGWMDSLVVTFPGGKAIWYENPRGKEGPWKCHPINDNACNETPLFADLLGNGKPVLIFPTGGRMAWYSVPKDLEAPWDVHYIAAAGQPGGAEFSHGLGCGDLNGDKRNDVLVKEGWWEAPEDRTQSPWTFHPANFGADCADMIVYDVDGDGLADVITSSAHQYGIWWHQQVKTDKGIEFKQQDIFPKLTSETHAIVLAELYKGGNMGFVTGKRFWAHGPTGDPARVSPRYSTGSRSNGPRRGRSSSCRTSSTTTRASERSSSSATSTATASSTS